MNVFKTVGQNILIENSQITKYTLTEEISSNQLKTLKMVFV